MEKTNGVLEDHMKKRFMHKEMLDKDNVTENREAHMDKDTDTILANKAIMRLTIAYCKKTYSGSN